MDKIKTMSEKITTLGRLEKTQEEIEKEAQEAIDNPNQWTDEDMEWARRELGDNLGKNPSRQELIKELDFAKKFMEWLRDPEKSLPPKKAKK